MRGGVGGFWALLGTFRDFLVLFSSIFVVFSRGAPSVVVVGFGEGVGGVPGRSGRALEGYGGAPIGT